MMTVPGFCGPLKSTISRGVGLAIGRSSSTAASLGGVKDRLVGDGLVPVDSALGRHKDRARALEFPAERQWVACETGHLDLLSRRDVYERVAGWLAGKGRREQ